MLAVAGVESKAFFESKLGNILHSHGFLHQLNQLLR